MAEKPLIIGTGLSGLVGSRIVELLGSRFDFRDFSLETGVDILNFDLLQKSFEKYPQAKTVLHLAAFTDTNQAWEQRGDKEGICYRLNVEGTENIVNLCQKYQKYLIYFSTDFVFDGKKEGVYTEKDQPSPVEWYGQTKLWGEEVVLKAGLPAAIIRIAFPFRAHFEVKKDILRKMIEGLENQSLYPLFADQIITPTFIDDIVKGIACFIENSWRGIFHLVGSSFLSPWEIGLLVSEIFGFDKHLIKKGSLREYLVNQPPEARPWQRNLALSNQKVAGLGIKMRNLRKALLEVKEQVEAESALKG